MGVGGGALSDRFQLRLERIEKPQLTIKGGAALRVERDRGAAQPGEVFAGEQIASGSFNEPLVKEAVDAILDARAVVHEHGTFGGALAHAAGFIRRNPDAGEEVGTEELGENEGVDFVGFDFGLGDGFGAHGVADDDFFDEGLEECGDGPGVGGGFQSDAVLGSEVLTGEGFKDGADGEKALAMEDLAGIVDEHRLDFFFVDVETAEAWHTDIAPPFERGLETGVGSAGRVICAGNADDAESWAERQLFMRARGSTG